MLQYSSRHSRQQAAAAAGGAGDDAAQRQQPQEPLGLEGMRALLLQRVPAPVADLRRRHVAAEQPEQRRQLAGCILQELLLRLCICAYGAC